MLNIAAGFSTSGYNLTRSLRFRASATAWLGRTPASATNRQIWTWSGWVKRGSLSSGTIQTVFNASVDLSNFNELRFTDTSSGVFEFSYVVAGADTARLTTTAVYRDPSAWYHFVVAVDTTQATAANRIKVYVNGSQVTAFTTATYPALNANMWINSANQHGIGITRSVGRYFDGYLADTYLVDGQALTPSSFGETNALTGVWQPKAYTGTYGTNGFYLDFEDTSSVAALGTDKSGNGNTWTVNNISVTAGVTYDSMTDVPTLTNATTANYAVLNPLAQTSGASITNGNLTITGGNVGTVSTIIPTSGKWYWEVTLIEAYVAAANYFGGFGVTNGLVATYEPTLYGAGVRAYNTGGAGGGGTYVNNTQITSSGTWAVNDVIGFAFDVTNLTLDCYRNNVKIGTTLTVPAGYIYPTFYQNGTADTSSSAANFGQRPFAYTPPTGFVALNTFNLPTATILKGNTVMDATLYTGNGSTQTITNAAGFQPDLVWVKDRTNAFSNILYDSVRGVGTTKMLSSNLTDAEGSLSANANLTSFNTNGFSVGTTGSTNVLNNTGDAFVGWQWQAGQGTTSSNTNGSITSQVSVNPTAGFSVVTYTGNGTNGATVGHGLGVAPKMFIIKARNLVSNWGVYHASIGNTAALTLDTTNAISTSALWFNNTSPTSSVFSLGTIAALNTSGTTHVAYCFAEIDGFSKFGSYTGNGSADGPFVYLGFRPKFVMIKRTNNISNWTMRDTSRSSINVTTADLYANLSDAESTSGAAIDFLSNGFKLRDAGGAATNATSSTYIYAAFAENPTKYALAR